MHRDINFGAPFMRIANPLINSQVAIWIGVLSLVLVLPAYFIGTKIMKATLFGNCREITTTKNVVRF